MRKKGGKKIFEEKKNVVNIQVVCSNSNPKHVLPTQVGMNRWKQECKSINSRVICYPLSLHKRVGENGDQLSDSGLILK